MRNNNPFLLVLHCIGALLFLPFWYMQRILPRDKRVWLFGSWFGQKYSDNSRGMYEYVLAHEPHIHPMWITHSKDVYVRLHAEGKPVAMAHSWKGRWWCLRAGVVFITTAAAEMNAKYLNGARMVWLWHGMVIKQIMADEVRFKNLRYSTFKRIKVAINNFLFPWENHVRKDAVLSTAEFFNPFLASAFEVDDAALWTDGYPRNDALFATVQEEIIKRYRQQFPTAKFIIYMPTHRLNERKGTPFNGFDGFGFDQETFFKVLEEQDYVFFNKGHFYDSGAQIGMSNPRFLNVTDKDFDNLYTFVKDMDILMTDFSSIYIDYLLVKKPIILAPFDYDDYITGERPLYFDYNDLEGARANNWDEVLRILREGSYSDPSEAQISRFHRYVDGDSARRITAHIQENWH